ncbi:MAG: chromosome segregation protein, partial [Verrucomicrobiales bacterium]|nr:chromosome segregation protein [Verrucomicrobiales bacterium]
MPCLVPIILFAIASAPSLMAGIDFNRDIRPLLAENCFQCHGPDAATRKAELRLDLPGNVPDNLTTRIAHHDPEEIMPPTSSKRSLTQPQIDLLTAWVDAGAPYVEHWAWQKPDRPEVPAIDDAWIKNPIDAFIL